MTLSMVKGTKMTYSAKIDSAFAWMWLRWLNSNSVGPVTSPVGNFHTVDFLLKEVDWAINDWRHLLQGIGLRYTASSTSLDSSTTQLQAFQHTLLGLNPTSIGTDSEIWLEAVILFFSLLAWQTRCTRFYEYRYSDVFWHGITKVGEWRHLATNCLDTDPSRGVRGTQTRLECLLPGMEPATDYMTSVLRHSERSSVLEDLNDTMVTLLIMCDDTWDMYLTCISDCFEEEVNWGLWWRSSFCFLPHCLCLFSLYDCLSPPCKHNFK